MNTLHPAADSDRGDAAAFVARAARVDDSGVLRLKQRDDGRVGLWVRTGFDVLATRSVFGTVEPTDVIADAAAMAASLEAGAEPVSLGFALPAAWRGALPGPDGYLHLDDVPARELIALARKGSRVAREESGALGPASSLLDQEVLTVSGGDKNAGITMRAVFALTSMGFVRDASGHEISQDSPLEAIAAAEPIRVRVSPAWIRVDARFGSVYQRSAALGVAVL
ncbi:hypothetical protein GOHSU_22_00260 [Gordonia hirsuta DSM 44140 = NBRC 16056]|uniref:Uncharacterized protein n=1 Tax=Gordonia hirsuta DSM 44140 = NBRC 16056 TaxID=1121927 RepID=L7LA03_9ACTN|nr:hypothetical protein [Gordonia hirsuta]GAC57566.1 hypothetical protein GOHSU_22_00260 [Gordonia hirsuta DSM 44140 = NBRC 16056]